MNNGSTRAERGLITQLQQGRQQVIFSETQDENWNERLQSCRLQDGLPKWLKTRVWLDVGRPVWPKLPTNWLQEFNTEVSGSYAVCRRLSGINFRIITQIHHFKHIEDTFSLQYMHNANQWALALLLQDTPTNVCRCSSGFLIHSVAKAYKYQQRCVTKLCWARSVGNQSQVCTPLIFNLIPNTSFTHLLTLREFLLLL